MAHNISVTAHIRSLDGQMDQVNLIKHNFADNNHVIVEYKGKRCTAVWNPFVLAYYVDDVYGLIPEGESA